MGRLWVAVAVTSGPTRWMYAGSVLITIASYVQSTRSSGANPRFAPALPFAFLLLSWTILRAAALALVRREIRWRDTTYALDDLRRNRL